MTVTKKLLHDGPVAQVRAPIPAAGGIPMPVSGRGVEEFRIKLRYLDRNPIKRGLVKEAADWKWSSFRHHAFREMGVVEIESEWTARDRENGSSLGSARVFLRPG